MPHRSRLSDPVAGPAARAPRRRGRVLVRRDRPPAQPDLTDGSGPRSGRSPTGGTSRSSGRARDAAALARRHRDRRHPCRGGPPGGARGDAAQDMGSFWQMLDPAGPGVLRRRHPDRRAFDRYPSAGPDRQLDEGDGRTHVPVVSAGAGLRGTPRRRRSAIRRHSGRRGGLGALVAAAAASPAARGEPDPGPRPRREDLHRCSRAHARGCRWAYRTVPSSVTWEFVAWSNRSGVRAMARRRPRHDP